MLVGRTGGEKVVVVSLLCFVPRYVGEGEEEGVPRRNGKRLFLSLFGTTQKQEKKSKKSFAGTGSSKRNSGRKRI